MNKNRRNNQKINVREQEQQQLQTHQYHYQIQPLSQHYHSRPEGLQASLYLKSFSQLAKFHVPNPKIDKK